MNINSGDISYALLERTDRFNTVDTDVISLVVIPGDGYSTVALTYIDKQIAFGRAIPAPEVPAILLRIEQGIKVAFATAVKFGAWFILNQ